MSPRALHSGTSSARFMKWKGSQYPVMQPKLSQALQGLCAAWKSFDCTAVSVDILETS